MNISDTTNVCDFEGHRWRIVINAFGKQGPQNTFNVLLMRKLDSDAYHARNVGVGVFKKLAEVIGQLPADCLQPNRSFSQRDAHRYLSYESITLHQNSEFEIKLQLTRRKGKVAERKFFIYISADASVPALLAVGDEIQGLIDAIVLAHTRVLSGKTPLSKIIYEYQIGNVVGRIKEPQTIDPKMPYASQLKCITWDSLYGLMGGEHYDQFEEHSVLVKEHIGQYFKEHFGVQPPISFSS